MIPTYMHYNFKCSQCFENLLKGLLNELSISIQVSIHFCDSHMKQVLLSILESIKRSKLPVLLQQNSLVSISFYPHRLLPNFCCYVSLLAILELRLRSFHTGARQCNVGNQTSELQPGGNF